MARPQKCRCIARNPAITAFKPAGLPTRTLDTIELHLDELEAIRLADLDGLYQDAAAEQMGISRPTFSRVIQAARHKVADALLNSKALLFQGGNVTMAEMRKFTCTDCRAQFEVPFGTGRPTGCPECSSDNIYRSADDNDQGGRRGRARCQRRKHGPRGRGRSAGRAAPAAEPQAVPPSGPGESA